MAQRTETELKVFLEGTLKQYNELSDTDKAGSVFFDKTNHAVYAKGECIIQSNIKDVTYDSTTTILTITPFTGTPIPINLGIQSELEGLETTLKTWVGNNYVAQTTFNVEIAKKVDKVNGSRLMTDAEGTKLAGIEKGAQANRHITVNDSVIGTDANSSSINITGNLIRVHDSENGLLEISLYGTYDSGQKKIFFRTNDTTDAEDLFVIDATDFIKDSFVKAGSYDSDKQALILTLVTGKDDSDNDITEDVEIPVGALVDEYTAGDGIDVTNNVISAKLGNGLQFDNTANNKKITLKPTTNGGIKVDANGVAVDWTKAPVQSVNELTGALTITGETQNVDDEGYRRVTPITFETSNQDIVAKTDAESIAILAVKQLMTNGLFKLENISISEDVTETDYELKLVVDNTPKVWSF